MNTRNYIPNFNPEKPKDVAFTFLKLMAPEDVKTAHFDKHYVELPNDGHICDVDNSYYVNVNNVGSTPMLVSIVEARIKLADALLSRCVTFFTNEETGGQCDSQLHEDIVQYLKAAPGFAYDFKIYFNLHLLMESKGVNASEEKANKAVDCISKTMRINEMYSYFVNVLSYMVRKYKLPESVWE